MFMQRISHNCRGFTLQQFEKWIKITGAGRTAHRTDTVCLSCKLRMSYLCGRYCIIFIFIGHDDICYLIIFYQVFLQALGRMSLLPASPDSLW